MAHCSRKDWHEILWQEHALNLNERPFDPRFDHRLLQQRDMSLQSWTKRGPVRTCDFVSFLWPIDAASRWSMPVRTSRPTDYRLKEGRLTKSSNQNHSFSFIGNSTYSKMSTSDCCPRLASAEKAAAAGQQRSNCWDDCVWCPAHWAGCPGSAAVLTAAVSRRFLLSGAQVPSYETDLCERAGVIHGASVTALMIEYQWKHLVGW